MADEPIERDTPLNDHAAGHADSVSMWSTLLMVLGALATGGQSLLDNLHIAPSSNVGIIATAVISIAGLVCKTLNSLNLTHATAAIQTAQAANPDAQKKTATSSPS